MSRLTKLLCDFLINKIGVKYSLTKQITGIKGEKNDEDLRVKVDVDYKQSKFGHKIDKQSKFIDGNGLLHAFRGMPKNKPGTYNALVFQK